MKPANSAQVSILIVLLVILVALSSWTVYNSNSPNNEKWEYKIEAIPDTSFDTEINNLGKLRWELVFARRASVSGSTSEYSYEMIFKRKLR